MAPFWARQQPYFQMGKGKGYGKGPHYHGPPGGNGQQPLASKVGGADGWTTGTIRRLFVGKGFGFISRDDWPSTSGRGDVFLHFSDLEAGLTSADLALGSRMKFKWEASQDSRGPGGRARMVGFVEDSHGSSSTPPRRAARTGRVYRKDLFLTVQQQLKTAGEYEERRPFGTRSLLGPLPSKVIFPFTITMPDWYWEAEDERALAEATDAQRLQMLEARLDQENGADLNNGETFGDDWALQSWSYEEAVAANQRLAKHQPVPHWVPQHEGLAEFFQPLVLQ